MTAHVCGIDIGKTAFHLIGLSKEGKIVAKRRFSRKQLIVHTVNMPACLIGMEACPGAHYLAQGHEVKLMPAEYVRPFVKSNKNDYIDAEAIAEAVQRPRCDLSLSRAKLSLIFRPCTVCAIAGWGGGPP